MKRQLGLLALGAILAQFCPAAPALADNDYDDFRDHQRQANRQIRKANRAAFYGNYWKASKHERNAMKQQRKAYKELYDWDD